MCFYSKLSLTEKSCTDTINYSRWFLFFLLPILSTYCIRYLLLHRKLLPKLSGLKQHAFMRFCGLGIQEQLIWGFWLRKPHQFAARIMARAAVISSLELEDVLPRGLAPTAVGGRPLFFTMCESPQCPHHMAVCFLRREWFKREVDRDRSCSVFYGLLKSYTIISTLFYLLEVKSN